MEDFLEDEINNLPEGLCNKCARCLKGYPVSYWEKMPEGCGYEGWLFQKREKIKQKTRQQKELLLSLKILLKTSSAEQVQEINKKIENIEKNINVYAKYGSINW